MRVFSRLIIILLAALAAACRQPAVPPTLMPTASPAPTSTPAQTSTPVVPVQATAVSQPGQKSYVRFVNAAPGLSAVNIYAGFSAVATNLGFAQSSQPTAIDAGDYTIKVEPTGGRPGEKTLLQVPVALMGSAAQVIALTGTGDQLKLTAFPETTDPLRKGESRITVLQASPDATGVTLRAAGKDLTQPLNFGQAALTQPLPPGQTALEFQSVGQTLLNYPLQLDDQTNYTLVLCGSAGQASVASFSAPAPSGIAVRLINAASALGRVDVYLDDALLGQNVNYSRAGERQNTTAGAHSVAVYPAGADRQTAQPLGSSQVTLVANQDAAIIVMGTPGKLRFIPYAEDLSPTPPQAVRFALLNTVETAQLVSVENRGGPLPGIPNIRYGDPPARTLLPNGTMTLYATNTAGGDTVEIAEDLVLQPGNSYLYLITGDTNNPVILTDNVGIDNRLAGVTSNVKPVSGAQVRFINVLNVPVDFLLNDQPAAANLAPGSASPLTPALLNNSIVGVRPAGGGDLLNSVDLDVQDGSRYTVVLYGRNTSSPKLLVVPDHELSLDEITPHIRLLNLSADSDAALGLGYLKVSESAAATVEPGTVTGRVQQLIKSQAAGSASSLIQMTAGTYDVYILDGARSGIRLTLNNVSLPDGANVDVIAYLPSTDSEPQAFTIVYPR
jgi:hypothetical protein